MDSNSNVENKKISELKNFDTLKTLLSYSSKKNIDIKNLNIDEYLIELHKIIFNSAGINSEEEYVNKLETLIFCLIENSDRISNNTKLFKFLSFFIKMLFDLLKLWKKKQILILLNLVQKFWNY